MSWRLGGGRPRQTVKAQASVLRVEGTRGGRQAAVTVVASPGGLCTGGDGSVFMCDLWWLTRRCLSGRSGAVFRVRKEGRLAGHQDTHKPGPKVKLSKGRSRAMDCFDLETVPASHMLMEPPPQGSFLLAYP